MFLTLPSDEVVVHFPEGVVADYLTIIFDRDPDVPIEIYDFELRACIQGR